MSDKLGASGQDKGKDQGSTPGKKKEKKPKGGKGGNPAGDGKGQGQQKTADGNKSPRATTKDKPTDVTNQTDPSKGQKPKGPQKAPNDGNQTDPNKPQKSKAELKAERRALQEQQRALKDQKKETGTSSKDTSSASVAKIEPKRVPDHLMADDVQAQKKMAKKLEKQKIPQRTKVQRQVRLFEHLHQYEREVSLTQSLSFRSCTIHPAIVRLGVQYAEGVICGSNARCLAMLVAFKQVIADYTTPAHKELSRDLEARIKPYISHGTSVTGLIAAVRDNNICIPGVAYNSTIVGVQLLGTNDNINNTVDSDEATAFLHYLSNVDIYSNSWGPQDGSGFEGPGYLAREALRDGVTTGRNGKGAIYVISAGNGGLDDNCNADGYANSIYTVAITSVQIGKNAWYSEVCAPALAATYGGSSKDKYLTTTTIKSRCTNAGIQGTSFSAPIASAIIAMTLEANPNLTWRDIQHLVVLTSNKNNFIDTFSDWSLNGANQEFSQVLGFGLMNAETMVSVGSKWKSVPQHQTCASRTKFSHMSTTSTKSDFIDISGLLCSTINYLEHVEVILTFSYTRYRGGTQLYLISPAGTKSNLLHHRKEDAEDNPSAGSLTWTFMSVHFWGETPIGNWTLQMSSTINSVKVRLDRWSLRFYGTTTDPWQTAIYRVVFVVETTVYQSSDITSLNNPSSEEFKDVKTGLQRFWSTNTGTSFYSLAINKLTPAEKGSIIVDQKVYTNENSVGSLIKASYDLVNNAESLRFGRISSLKVSVANITNYELPNNTVEITNKTQTNELCSIYTTFSKCSSKLKCKVSEGKPSCVSKSSSSTVNKGAIIGGVLGGIATTIALAGALYLHWKQRRQ